MRQALTIFGMLLLAMTTMGDGCLEEKVIDIVLNSETCAEFEENHGSDSGADPVTVDYGEEIAEILLENGYTRDDITTASIKSAAIEVTQFNQPTAWQVSGQVNVEWLSGGGSGGPVPIVNFSSESVPGLLHNKKPVDLNAAGVDLMNDALQAFLDGANPVLRFTITFGDISPDPTEQDRMIFSWKAYLLMNIVLSDTIEVFDLI